MYTFGWRLREVLKLQRRQLDLQAGTLTLDVGTTKNKEGRVAFLTPELKTRLAAQVERVKVLERKLGRSIPYLFVHEVGAQQQSVGKRHVAVVGDPIQNFRRAWETACTKAGAAVMLRHDFRRTGTRNLVRSGVPEAVAMRITGHKTRSVFERYNIVSSSDLQEASHKLAAHAAK